MIHRKDKTYSKNITKKIKDNIKNDYLAKGESYKDLSNKYDLSMHHIRVIIEDILNNIKPEKA